METPGRPGATCDDHRKVNKKQQQRNCNTNAHAMCHRTLYICDHGPRRTSANQRRQCCGGSLADWSSTWLLVALPVLDDTWRHSTNRCSGLWFVDVQQHFKHKYTTSCHKGKCKVYHTPLREHRWVLISLSKALRPCRWRTINVCDTWPVRHQTYGYFPSCKASPPVDWYQIILLGDRGTCVLTGLHSTAGRPRFEPMTCWSQVQHPNHSWFVWPLSHTNHVMGAWNILCRARYKHTVPQ